MPIVVKKVNLRFSKSQFYTMEKYELLITKGLVSLIGAKTRLPLIQILCDTGASQTVKVKCKTHNFFQIYTFRDSDRNNFQFAQDVCAKSSGRLTCLKPRKYESWLFSFKQYPVVTLFVPFLLFRGDKDTHTIFFFLCSKRLGGWTLVITSKVLRPQP